MRNINSIALEEIWKKDSDGLLPVLIEIYNPDLVWNGALNQEDGYLRVINDTTQVKYQDHIFIPATFEYNPPEDDGSKLGTASLTISSLDSMVSQLLGACEIPCEVKVVAAFAKKEYTMEDSEVTSVKYAFVPLTKYEFLMKSASNSTTTATLQFVNDDITTINLPRNQAALNQFPSYYEQS